MNIVVINHYQGSLKHSYSSRFASLSKYWCSEGHSVFIVSASFSHLYTTQPNVPGLFSIENHDGANYLFLRTPKYSGNGIGRILNLGSFLGLLFLAVPVIALKVRPHTIIASSVYLLDTFAALAIACMTKGRFVREIRDIWPLSLVDLGLIKPSSPIVDILEWAERISINKADAVVSTLPNIGVHFLEQGLHPKKSLYIPQCIESVSPPPIWEDAPICYREAIHKLKVLSPFVVGVAGTLGHASTVDILLEAIGNLHEFGIGLVLIGDGPLKNFYQSRSLELQMDRVLFLPQTSRRECSALMLGLDCLYVGWESRRVYEFGISPNRILDYMLSGKPIIHARDYGNDPVEEAQCGISVPSGDVQRLTAAILEMSRLSPEERSSMGQRGPRYLFARHNAKLLAAQYLEALS